MHCNHSGLKLRNAASAAAPYGFNKICYAVCTYTVLLNVGHSNLLVRPKTPPPYHAGASCTRVRVVFLGGLQDCGRIVPLAFSSDLRSCMRV